MQDNSNEQFPIVDECGNIVGAATRGECHSGSKLLHPVVHLHLLNSKGELYLQRRPMWKDIQPGKWDTAVGGHVDFGESIFMALTREVGEELGITDFTPEQITHYVFESARERELVFVFKTVYDGVVTRIMDFGAFVEIAPGKEGMVHISHLDVKRTEKVEDVVNVGDEIIVEVLPIDEQGRLNLSRRNALIKIEGLTPENDISEQARKPRRDFDRKGGRNDRRK